jgi:hypothetical protein
MIPPAIDTINAAPAAGIIVATKDAEVEDTLIKRDDWVKRLHRKRHRVLIQHRNYCR